MRRLPPHRTHGKFAFDLPPFSPHDSFEPTSNNPLGSLLTVDDVPQQLDHLRTTANSYGKRLLPEHDDGHRRQARLGLDQFPLKRIDLPELASLLKRCSKTKALSDGRQIHCFICWSGCDRNTFLGNFIVDMYGNCGSIEDARSTFDRIHNVNVYSWNMLLKTYAQNGKLEDASSVFGQMLHRDVVSWNVMITAFVKDGQGKEALELFRQMQCEREAVNPDKVTFVCVLDACASLADIKEGQKIHAMIVGNGYEGDIVLGTALVNMYGKCGSPDDSMSIFGKISNRDVVAWNAMIAALVQNGHGMGALELWREMQQEGMDSNNSTFVCALDACAHLKALVEGREIYNAIVGLGYEEDVVVGTALINMFGKCGIMQDASHIFHKMTQRNVVTWNAMISALSQNYYYLEALCVFHEMQLEGIKPTPISFVCVLNACASSVDLHQGLGIHAAIICNGCAQDSMVESMLVHMYGMCQSLCNARSVFSRIHHHDVASWNVMMSSFTRNGHGQEALGCFSQMHIEGIRPDEITFVCALDACATLVSLEEGHEIYATILESGYEENIVIETALINMYGKCGSLYDARIIFYRMTHRNIISWNAMISALSQNEHGKEALDLFRQMQHEGINPDKITFICVLDVCANLAALKEGQVVYAALVSRGYEQDVAVGTSLLNMYGRCGSLCSAMNIFGRMAHWNVVSWNVIITVCTQNGNGKDALNLFHQMQLEGVQSDKVTFVCVLDACTRLTVIRHGQEVHAAVAATGHAQDVVVGTALVNMYGKCGCLHDARSVFDRLDSWNVVSWNAMISAFAQNGYAKEALNLFHEMQLKGLQPDEITFICILTACRHAGWLDDGRKLFVSMKKDYKMTYSLDHFVCMIDLLGCAGQLHEAENLINNMPCEQTAVAWLSLLGACRLHGELEMGIRAANQCFELDQKNASPHVTLSNLCAAVGMQEDVAIRGTTEWCQEKASQVVPT